MDNKRVLIVVRPAAGGILKHIRTIIKNLSEEFDFVVACPTEHMTDYENLPCPVVGIPLSGTLDPAHDLLTLWQLRSIVRNYNIGLIHAHGFKAGLVARPLSRISGVPCIVTAHSDFAHAKASRFPGILTFAERLLSYWTTEYVTVSAWMAQEMSRTLGIENSRITVIPNGIELEQAALTDELSLPFPSDTQIVVTVARLAPQKGLVVFLQAAAILASRYQTLCFVIAGDGPLRGDLEAFAQKLGLQERVLFLGHITQVSELLARSHVFVLSSISEAQGIAVMEAMHAGCPVVASRIGGLCEVVQNERNGILVPVGNAEAVATAVSKYIDDPVYASSMSIQAQLDVQKYGIGQSIQQTKVLYKRILEGRFKQ